MAVIGLSTATVGALPTGTATLSGVVTGAASPVSGADVSLCPSDGGDCPVIQTGAQGGYAFDGIPDGEYTLSVSPPSSAPYLLPAVDLAVSVNGDTGRDVALTSGGRLSFTVTLPNGGGAAAEQPVTVCRTSPSGADACPAIAWTGTTDAAGAAETIALLPGDYSVRAGYNGPSTYPRASSATVTASTTASVPLVLVAPASLTGIVRGADGSPLPGASVAISAPGLLGSNATTDGNGRYSIASVQPGTYGGTVSPPSGSLLGSVPFADLVVGEGAAVTQDFALQERAAIYAASSSSVGPTSSGGVGACLVPGEPRLVVDGGLTRLDCGDGNTGPALTFTFGHVELAAGAYNVRNAYVVSGAVVSSPVVRVDLAPAQAVACTFVAGAPGSGTCDPAADGSWVFATVTDAQGVPFVSNGGVAVCNGTFSETSNPNALCSGAVSAFAIADAVGHTRLGPFPPGSTGVRGFHTVFSGSITTTWNTATSVTLTGGTDQTCTALVPGSTGCTAGTPAWAGRVPALTIAGTVTGNLGTTAVVVACRGSADPDPVWPGSGNACGTGAMATANVDLATGAYVVRNGSQSLAPGTYHLRPYATVNAALVAGTSNTVSLTTASLTGVGLTFGPPNVTTVTPVTGSDPVAITYPVGSVLTDVAIAPPPAELPVGATAFPAGVIGFSLTLATGQSSGDVTLTMPVGATPDAYWKLVDGVWTKMPTSGPGSYVTFSGDTVTLHLVDNDDFDTDPTVGVIGDPGGPSYSFKSTGFRAPIVLPTTRMKVGSRLPVKWRVTNALGTPSGDPTSFTSLTVTAPAASCGAGTLSTLADNAAALRYNGSGEWQFDWKTPTAKSAVGKCSTISLQLNDGMPAHTVNVQFTK